MAEPRVRRTETPLSTQDVEEYRDLVKLAQIPLPKTTEEAAQELTRLCRLRDRQDAEEQAARPVPRLQAAHGLIGPA